MGKDLSRSLARNKQTAHKHMKRCFTLLATREMKSTTTIRYYYIPNRMAIIKKTDHPECWRRCEGIRTLIHS